MKKGTSLLMGLLVGALWAQAAQTVEMQSPDGHYLATAINTPEGSSIVMRDLLYEKKNGTNTLLVIPVNKVPVAAITFSADGQTMSTKETNGVERVWKIDRGGAATLLSTTRPTP